MAGSSLQLRSNNKVASKAVQGQTGAEKDDCPKLNFPFMGLKVFHPFSCQNSWAEEMSVTALSPHLLYWMLFKEPYVCKVFILLKLFKIIK